MEKKEILNTLEDTISSLNLLIDYSEDNEKLRITVNDAVDELRTVQWAVNIKMEDK